MDIRMRNEEIQHVLVKYLKEEKKWDGELHKCKEQRKKMESCLHLEKIRDPNRPLYMKNNEAKKRNQQLLSDLEMSRARLRTLTSFTPTEQELAERVMTYRKFLLNI